MIKPNLIQPFYFPTSVIFVDDNTDFLENLSLQLDPDLAFLLYGSPVEALTVVNEASSSGTPIERLFSCSGNTDNLMRPHHVIDVNLDKVHREVYNQHRFEQISVAVVDYDMPGIDGIEFCRNIKNTSIKKILLTGKADEKIAVQAFNQGIIDCFITKQDKDVTSILNNSVAQLQYAYFNQTERMLADTLAIGRFDFLRDPLFQQEFNALCARLKIVEFYLCSEPDGMLMLNGKGESYLLIVPSEDTRLSQYEIAVEMDAPQELLDALKNNKVVPYFWRNEGHYFPEYINWRDDLFPATEFKGKKSYTYAIVENPVLFKAHTILPYHMFLDNLDLKRRCKH